MSRGKRIEAFRAASERFFEGSDWLFGATGAQAIAVQVLAALTRFIIDQVEARWEAVLDQPIGLPASGYDVPAPGEVVDWFAINPRYPELSAQFAAEIAADDWPTLQKAHRVLTELLVFERPLLRACFADELAARDFRAIVDGYDAAKAEVDKVLRAPKAVSLLREWYDLLTEPGPAPDADAAREALRERWGTLVRYAVGVDV